MKKLLIAMLLASLLPVNVWADAKAEEKKPEEKKEAAPAAPAGPQVTITLKDRTGRAIPHKTKCSHTGGGTTIVEQTGPDTFSVTMIGVAVACPHPCKCASASMKFDLDQCFEVAFASDKVKKAKVTLTAQVIGALRSHCKNNGQANSSQACASIGCVGNAVVEACLPEHAVASGENMLINDHVGPRCSPIFPGDFSLKQTWCVNASVEKGLFCKAPSAEFAPDPALDPLWISAWEPFHGTDKKAFGFKVVVKVEAVD